MSESLAPLSIAFIWHMHQPEYKDDFTGEYLMPWVRLHAVKDYLDMVLILEKYPRIRQTFNLVPSLIDQLEDYCLPETRDRHMTVTMQETLSEDDKLFVFKRFFDASSETMIARSPYYYSLFERRNRSWEEGEADITQFSDAEYHDLTALFHLVWFDPLWIEKIQELKELWNKGKGYTLSERIRIIEIQRELIQKTLPTYKKFQDNGQIEVTTTPYYHPILPLLIDTNSAKVAMPDAVLPEAPFQYPEDAAFHVSAAREKYYQVFGTYPVGCWPAEQSISPEAVRMIKEQGFQWAVSSEGNLSCSLGIPFEKDPFGNIQNVDVLCQPYQAEGLTMIFRHLTLSDLIGFHYSNLPPEQAAHDLIQRLKQIQKRCTEKGLQNPIVTIALDGENCWEFFEGDGHAFLDSIYTQLSQDETLDVCRVQDYLKKIPPQAIQPLKKVHSGSWINSNFHIWIGDPVKNAAWTYLKRTRKDLDYLSHTGHYQPEILKKAWKEIYIAEGSDWFWWYGEPHNSGQDEIFDMQFRRHLANIYRLLDMDIPNYLDIPLTITMGRPVMMPQKPISPMINGKEDSQDDWQHAGYFDLTHGAMHRSTRIVNKVFFGSDDQNGYVRFELNPDAITPYHEIYLYFCTPGKTRHNSPVRIKAASGKTVSTQRYHYAYEIQLSQLLPGKLIAQAAEALPDHLWYSRSDIVTASAIGDLLEIVFSFQSMDVHPEEYLQFAVAMVQGDVLEEFEPENFMLSLQRYDAEACQSSKDSTAEEQKEMSSSS